MNRVDEARWLRSAVASMSDENKLEFQPQYATMEGGAMDWKKTLMIGSFAAGAILFLTGRRPAGLAVAGIGVATFAAEHPEKFEELWHRMPEYIEKGSKFVDMASTFLERMGQERGGYHNMPVAGGNRY
jgi:S-formylglutathione hydrolase FrmB